MYRLFAGFTYCDGFPFGGDDGTAGVVAMSISLFLGVVLLRVLWPLTAIFKRHGRQHMTGLLFLAISGGWLVQAVVANISFVSRCRNNQFIGIFAPSSPGDIIVLILQGTLGALICALVLRLLTRLISKYFKRIFKKS